MEQLDIIHGARKCAANWHENTGPTWQGTALTSTFTKDHIKPPQDVASLFIRFWSE